jgi:hypothetical protein
MFCSPLSISVTLRRCILFGKTACKVHQEYEYSIIPTVQQ